MSDSPEAARGGSANPAVDIETAKELASEADREATNPTLLQQIRADREYEQQLEVRLRPFLDRLAENVARINRLLQFFDEELSKREGGDDILRAAVVFIHAYLEDLAELGIHGTTPTEVARTLLTVEVERLVKDGFIRLRTLHSESEDGA